MTNLPSKWTSNSTFEVMNLNWVALFFEVPLGLGDLCAFEGVVDGLPESGAADVRVDGLPFQSFLVGNG